MKGEVSNIVIEGVSSAGRVGTPVTAAVSIAHSDGARVILPVRRADLLYANFRHIQVLPDTRLQEGIPVYKLKLLDTLIDRFARPEGSGFAAGLRKLTPGSVDGLLEEITRWLRSAGVRSAPYRPRFPLGTIVDLLA